MSEICFSSFASASTAWKSPISSCSSTSACMVVQPVCRQGLSTAALEKQTFHGPSVLYCVVSTISGSSACDPRLVGRALGLHVAQPQLPLVLLPGRRTSSVR